jgi:16S rRNA (cytosine967-C5)-methyltransferase
MSSARRLALEAIGRVIDEGAYSNRVWPAMLARSGLDRRDRAFATGLMFGVLRARLQLDAAIEACSTRPIGRMEPRVANLLRLGAFQVLDLDVPDHAAVGETVTLAGGRERGFVNAVLRRLAADRPGPPMGADDDAVSVRTGMASWAVSELRAVLGGDPEAAARALAAPAPLCIRATRDRSGLLAAILAAGHGATAGEVDPSCILIEGGSPAELPGYDEGAFAVQDQASSFVARVVEARPGDLVADVCAAPGGKALALAAAVAPSGAAAAGDLRPSRLAAIGREARRLGVRPLVFAHDAKAPALRAGAFDRVLVDAPCSGLGSARRRPELLWRVAAADVPGLAARQLAIVTAAADLLRPGGRLVYAVCTFTRAETDAVIDVVVRRRRELRPIAVPGPDGVRERHRLWSHEHGSDGMFVAAFERVS